MTLNVGGGKVLPSAGLGPGASTVISLIREIKPDVLAIQEATEWVTWDEERRGWVHTIASECGFGDRSFYAPSVSMTRDFNAKKTQMVDALLSDMAEWSHGQALFSSTGYVQLSHVNHEGRPRTAMLFRPSVYEGFRDSEPREMLLARLAVAPFPLLATTHWTTILNERDTTVEEEVRASAISEALVARKLQADRLCMVLGARQVRPSDLVVLMGDFNAVAGEESMQVLLEAGFKLLEGPGRTHPEVPEAIDHILVRPADRLRSYRCWSIDDSGSDHAAVVADIDLAV